MCKSVLLASAAALSLGVGAFGQSARLDVQVSSDNVNWSDSLYAPAGSRFYVRAVASTTHANAKGLANLTFQPTLTGWTAADTRLFFTGSNGAAVPPNSTIPANTGRQTPYGAAAMNTSSTPGLLTSFNDSGTLRFAGSRASTMTTNLDYGVICNQNPKPSYPSYSQATGDLVIFKYGIELSASPTLRTMTADIPLAGIKGAKITWYGSLISSGSPFDIPLTQADIDPAVISVGPPNTAPTASADTFNMLEDQTLFVTTGSVLNNDGDPDVGDTMTAELVTGAANGSLTFNADGTFSYIPAPDYHGTESFTYRVRDRLGAMSNTATVTINVADVNDEPVFTAADPGATLEDSGQRVIPNWATFNPGPGESQGVLEYEVMAVGNIGLFAPGGHPTVSNDGTLRYTAASNMSGDASFEVRVRDTGGTNNGGSDMSAPRTFGLSVLPVNDAPVVTVSPITDVSEDSGQRSIPGWATFNPGPGEGDQVLLGYSVGSISNPSLFAVQPTVAPDGTLVYTPAANASGTSTFSLTARDSGGVANGGSDTSPAQVITINVLPVNDAPTFAAVNPPVVLEDSGAQTIANWASFNSGGGAGEASQAVAAYIVSGVSNPSLFSATPAVSNAGTLSYTLAPNASGLSTFSVQVRDNGGTANGGSDTSAAQVFTINVTPVNDAPTFVAPATTSSTEDAGPVAIPAWAAFSAGAGEAGQGVLAYTVSNISNPSLFASAPSISADGTLTFTPAPNASGTSTFQLRVRDDGGVANGGVDTSLPQTLTISIAAVNDAPIVALGSVPGISEDSGSQSVSGFASFNAGAANESGQSLLGYTVSDVSDPAMFASGPSVSNAGTLTYTPAPNAFGSVTFTVRARDNGGTANGGVDTSAPVQATITINPVNDPPTFAAVNPPASLEDAGQASVANWAAFNPGPNESGQSVLAYSVSVTTNAGLFATPPAVSNDGTLTYTPASNASGSATIQVRVRDNGGGLDQSSAQTFTINVTPVNDAPSVALNAIPTIVEDGGSQTVPGFASFSAGPGEGSQSLIGYTVANVSNPAMFSAGPSVSNSGTLTYTPSSNASGTVTFTVQARDNGGVANGGADTSLPVQATLSITNVNDAPTFAAVNPPASLEDAGPVSVAAWAAFNPGPFEDGQAATYEVTGVSNPSLFTALPSVSPAGVLSYQTGSNASGTSTFSVRVRDNGGTASGGVDVSGVQTFTVSVTPVNDPPVVTVGTAPVIEEDSGMQFVGGFAQFSPGPGESGQALVEYYVSDISNPAAFTIAPIIMNSGTMTYTPAPNASGTITFTIRARDNGGTENGGIDVSAPSPASITINGVNDPPVAVARDVTIDARTGCTSLVVGAAQIDAGSYDPDNGPSELTYRINRTGEFNVGVTPVVLTVTDAAGLSSTANATVTVLAADANRNGVPDSCDLIRGGGGPDCDDDGDNDESQCVWDNGAASPLQSTVNGQLSQYGGNIAMRVADDFYLQPGLLYRITSFRGQILTNSIEREARLEFFKDCDGKPVGEPIASFTSSSVASESSGDNGKTLVTYVFEFCDEKFVLEGGFTYWVSLQGKVNCNNTDQAFWAIVGTEADPRDMIAGVPCKAAGVDGGHPCTISGYDEWLSIADCCIGCANMSFLMTGEPCQLLWDNGKVDVGATRGGDPSGVNRGIFSRAADNIVVKPCRTETICWFEAYIWTNCPTDQLAGFLEIYDNSCTLPAGPSRHRVAPTDVTVLDHTVRIENVEYRLLKLEFWNVPFTLVGGRNYWISVGADGTGSFSTRSFFAWADPLSPCGCSDVHFTKGAVLPNRQSDSRWLRSNREYAFRIATKPFFMDPVVTNIPPARSCRQDFNQDRAVTIQDLFEYLQAYFAGCP